jgi:hypothetical protein
VRPYWKGYLKLALVSCPIALHAACSTAERIALRQINKATGNRLRQQLIDEETREPVAPEHKGRGYEVAKNDACSKLRRATSCQIAGGYWNGCSIPFRQNLQEISKDIQDGPQA